MRFFFRILGAGALSGLLSCAAFSATRPFLGPYIQGLEEDSVLVLWETEVESAGVVEFGESIERTAFVRETTLGALHKIALAGLTADTRYFYRVHWEGTWSSWASFRTRPPPGTRRLRFCAYGDSRSNPAVHARIVQEMLRFEPELVLHTGDLVMDGTKREQWKPQFFDPLAPLAAGVPIVPAIGNHENDSTLYYDYFSLPSKKGWFSYRWANVHFLVLDSQADLNPNSEQTKWLREELKTPRGDWRIVFCHSPMFSCHPTREVNENRWAWQDLFDEGGVDLVLTGHDHYYHRTLRIGRALEPGRDGVHHITTAGGGAPLYPVEAKVYSAVARSLHHFLLIEVEGRILRGRAVDADGNVFDEFTIDRVGRDASPLVSYEMILWENTLKAAVDALEPTPLAEKSGRVERTLELPTIFTAPVRLGQRWSGGSSFWAQGEAEGVFTVAPGAPFRVGITGEGPLRTMYPLPRLELSVLPDPAAGSSFVNRTISLQPLKLGANQVLQARRLAGPIQLDGKVSEAEWRSAAVARGFTRDFGRILSERETFYLGYNEEAIYVAARIQTAVEAPCSTGARDHDTRHMYRTDEAVSVILSPPGLQQVVFMFCGNARGTKFDSFNNVREWEPVWDLATSETAAGWEVELKIPWLALGALGPIRQEWRFNLLRWDTRDKALSEWAPTFTPLGTDRKHDARLKF